MPFLRLFYNLLYLPILIALVPWLIWRMLKRGKYRHKFGQRFAIYSQRVRTRLQCGGWIWVHAVSVGEVLIAMKLIRRLKERDPSRTFVLSTTTSTGFVLACEQRSEWLEAIYHPLDFIWFTRRAIRLIKPSALVLIEAEVWPNLVAGIRATGARGLLANARLSPRSERRFRKFRAFTGPVFNQLDTLCLPDPEDIARWKNLGVREDKLCVTGSIKFDDALATKSESKNFVSLLATLGISESAPVFLGASTHAGEELLLAQVCRRLRQTHPGLLFISVPRHVERTPEIRAALEKIGLTVALHSEIPNSKARNPDVLLVDSTGELRHWYACAQVVFVGKSLLAKGGQNPAEPITAGRAVIVGPNMQNFDLLVRQLVRAQGLIQIPDEAALEREASRLLSDPTARASLVEHGQAIIASHRGATDRTCDAIAALTQSA